MEPGLWGQQRWRACGPAQDCWAAHTRVSHAQMHCTWEKEARAGANTSGEQNGGDLGLGRPTSGRPLVALPWCGCCSDTRIT